MDITHLATLVLRQEQPSEPVGTAAATGAAETGCEANNNYDGRMGIRISAIFVIFVGSTMGALFPVFARKRTQNRWLEYCFFFAKYFGSGVIVATAFIHLLAPAVDALNNPCLTGPVTSYPWPMGIALMMVFVLFFVELMTVRYAGFGHSHTHDEEDEVDHGHKHSHDDGHESKESSGFDDDSTAVKSGQQSQSGPIGHISNHCDGRALSHVRGEDHLGHGREHFANEPENDLNDLQRANTESYASQLTAIFILEFGIIFHSIFIGLTLAVAGSEFITLYIVLVFHQTFEGLGLGTRLATIPWPKSKRWTPYLLGLGYGVSTPIAIAIGLGVRQTFAPGSATTLIVNGVFDSISAGILIYTGLVELMAHEFMFSPSMRKAPIKTVLTAFFSMVLGAGLMAILGKWA